MRRFKFLTLLGLIVITISSCVSIIPISKDFYTNEKKTGVIYVIDSIGFFKAGSQGLLDMALTPGNRFYEPLQIVDKKINPTNKIKEFYSNFLNSKSKSFIEIDFTFNREELNKFEKPSNTNKKYFKYDFRELKDKGINELVIINVKYGLLVSYYGIIETGKVGRCIINTKIIDLNDNSLIYKNFNIANKEIKGNWKTPPNYENLEESIRLAIDAVIEKEKNQLNK